MVSRDARLALLAALSYVGAALLLALALASAAVLVLRALGRL